MSVARLGTIYIGDISRIAEIFDISVSATKYRPYRSFTFSTQLSILVLHFRSVFRGISSRIGYSGQFDNWDHRRRFPCMNSISSTSWLLDHGTALAQNSETRRRNEC